MKKIGIQFEYSKCTNCSENWHCGAAIIADSIIGPHIETELLDKTMFAVQTITSNRLLAIAESEPTESFAVAYEAKFTQAEEDFKQLIRDTNKLIEDGLVIRKSVDDQLIRGKKLGALLDSFVEVVPVVTAIAPSHDDFSLAMDEVVNFQDEGRCYQVG